MKNWVRWSLIVVAVAALLMLGGRWLKSRQASTGTMPSLAASAPTEQTLEVADIDLLRIARGELTRGIEVSGSLKAVNSAFVKAKVAAELKSMSVREGDTVQAGQVLAQLDTTEFDWRLRQAEQQTQAAKAQLDIAERQLANNKALVAQGFISPTALESTASSEAAARATWLANKAAEELARKARVDTTLVAPISGQISQRLVQPGERLAIDARLLEIVDLSKLELEAAVPPDDLAQLRVGQVARLAIDGSNQALEARVARINPSAQAGSRTVAAYLALQPHPMLRQGLFTRGWIELERRNTLQLPLSAVRTDQAKPYAIRVNQGRTERVTLTLGTVGKSGTTDVVEVLQGLADGDQVLSGSTGVVPAGVAVRVTAATRANAIKPPASAVAASSPAAAASR
ncbi:MAG: efflux RND transporter periplasmic adaptor subunit [Ideonella sp.]|nr:efflux RND transporter periplasmic adaptor subunit [Ideonella sp.]MBL0148111.1 efflux RND transporter periplasmic adaptor subunit [Ideonella sp.]